MLMRSTFVHCLCMFPRCAVRRAEGYCVYVSWNCSQCRCNMCRFSTGLFDEKEFNFARTMGRFWTNVAASGNPNLRDSSARGVSPATLTPIHCHCDSISGKLKWGPTHTRCALEHAMWKGLPMCDTSLNRVILCSTHAYYYVMCKYRRMHRVSICLVGVMLVTDATWHVTHRGRT